MSTISFSTGDVILIRVPLKDGLQTHARPALVVRDAAEGDKGIFVTPITPDSIPHCNALLVALGCYEAARMGLVTPAYLNASKPVAVPRRFVIHRIGQVPHLLRKQFFELYSVPLDLPDNFSNDTYF